MKQHNYNVLEDNLDIIHKILIAHRVLLQERIDGNYLPLYTSGWMSLKRQFSTVGFIGAAEFVYNLGFDTVEEGKEELKSVLLTIEKTIKQWQKKEEKLGYTYNIEQIPGESVAVRLAKLDNVLGFNNTYSDGQMTEMECVYELYSNQYVPLIENTSIYNRIQLQGEFDSLTSGGAICHININDHKPLRKDQFLKMINTAKDAKAKYFAVNYAFSKCVDGHMFQGLEKKCPVCGKEVTDTYTRVVGFLTSTNFWNKKRREWEFPKRVFYKNSKV
jgi:ribonucleoside-triphosphate reductase